MFQALSAVLGFAAPFLPEVVKIFRERQENAHEKDMMELRLKHAAAEHAWRMEEINTQADIAEMQTLRQPQPSFGVQILDAARDSKFPTWMTLPVFWLFAFLDFASGMVRPSVTYAIVAFYMAVKYAIYLQAVKLTGQWTEAVQQVWDQDDKAILLFVLMFWFGQRAVKAAFGGSASSIKAGA